MTSALSTRLPRLARLLAPALVALGAVTACSSDRTPTAAEPRESISHADDVGAVPPAAITLGWNALTRTLIERNQPNQQAALRALTYAAFAEHQAIQALDSAVAGAALDARGHQALVRVALSSAAAEVLGEMFPRDSALIAERLAAVLDATPVTTTTQLIGPELTGGAHPMLAVSIAPQAGSADRGEQARQIGTAVGQAVVARARQDGFDAAWTGTVPTGYGVWASALTPARPPLLPRLGEARTFFLARGDEFRPPPPPAPGTPAFAAALAEVRRISDTRTAEQKRVAEFWAMTTGSLAAGYWNAVADSLIARDRLSESEAAHLLAVTNMAAWDGNVACHDAKYTYWLARPTQMDPQITTPIALPNHPSYPSNHACLSGAAAEVLARHFPADAAALRARAEEAMVSRVYAGLHYRFDGEAGLGIARQVAALAAREDAARRGRFPLR